MEFKNPIEVNDGELFGTKDRKSASVLINHIVVNSSDNMHVGDLVQYE